MWHKRELRHCSDPVKAQRCEPEGVGRLGSRRTMRQPRAHAGPGSWTAKRACIHMSLEPFQRSPPQSPAQMEKFNQTEFVLVAPGKLVVSVTVYLKVHLHIPQNYTETHLPGKRLVSFSQLPFLGVGRKSTEMGQIQQGFQNSTTENGPFSGKGPWRLWPCPVSLKADQTSLTLNGRGSVNAPVVWSVYAAHFGLPTATAISPKNTLTPYSDLCVPPYNGLHCGAGSQPSD